MLNKRQLIFSVSKYLIRGGIAIVLAVVLVMFFGSRIAKISNSISEQRLTASILDRRQETIAQLQKDFEIIGNADQKIAKAFPPVDNVLEFAAALDNLAGQNSIQQKVNFDNPSEDELSINYVISFDSNIFNLKNYLKGFELLPYFTAISSLELQSSTDSNWDSDSLISFKATVYSQPATQ